MRCAKINGNSKTSLKPQNNRKRPSFGSIAIAVIIAIFAVVILRGLSNDQTQKAAYQAAHPTPPPGGWARKDVAHLNEVLNRLFAPALANSGLYSLAVMDTRGDIIYDNAASTAVVPASVQKIIIADATLNDFGPNYRFVTSFAADRPISQDGTLDSNLWIVFSGDPALRTNDLRDGVETLERKALREVHGHLALDSSALSGPEINPHWNPDDSDQDFQTAISAISIDGNTVEHDNGGNKTWTPISNIANFASVLLAKMFLQGDIKFSQPRPLIERAPLTSVALWQHESPPLSWILNRMLTFSDNHFAEQLLRSLGARSGKSNDDDGGIGAENAFLKARNIPIRGLFLVDGSGLADANRVSALTLTSLLNNAQQQDGGKLYALLPQAGKGTMKHYRFGKAIGRVRAKSGHLAIADSLAGYVDTLHHGRIEFAFMINTAPVSPDAVYSKVVEVLSTL